MKRNLGTADRIARLVAAFAIVALYFAETLTGTWALILGALAVVLTATSVFGFCPIYFPFGFTTRKSTPTA